MLSLADSGQVSPVESEVGSLDSFVWKEKEEMFKKCLFLGVALLVVAVSGAFADDIILPDQYFAGMGVAAEEEEIHYEPSYYDPGITDPDVHKGWATVTVYNSSEDNIWGDFHFQISGAESEIANVHFDESIAPISSQTLIGGQGSGWVIDNDAVGATLDLYFYNDPVGPGESATFEVYTDNTTDLNAWFGLCMYPTPVPEPATLVLLGLGGLFVRRLKK